jgi:type VI protein secretion system component VasF
MCDTFKTTKDLSKVCGIPLEEVIKSMKENPNPALSRQQRRSTIRYYENKLKKQGKNA